MDNVLSSTKVKSYQPSAKTESLVIGDSLLRNTWRVMKGAGVTVKCLPGIDIEGLSEIVEEMDVNPSVESVYLHVGTNNLSKSPSSDYITGDMWHLVRKVNEKLPNAKVIVSGILRRRDVKNLKTDQMNRDLQWMCEKSGVSFLDVNPFLSGTIVIGVMAYILPPVEPKHSAMY